VTARTDSGTERLQRQALGPPVEFSLSAELRFDAGDDASRAEAARCWFCNLRTAAFLPDQAQPTGLVLHLTISRPERVDSAPYFTELGHELMQRQRQRLGGGRTQLHLGPGQRDLVADRIGREFLVDQAFDFRALPARQRQHGVDAPRAR